MNKRIKLLLGIFFICFAFSITSATKPTAREGKVWLGIGYVAAKNGASAEAGLAIGAIGLTHATVHSIAWGMAFAGGPAGIIAGAVVGA